MRRNIFGKIFLLFLAFSLPLFAEDKLITERDLEGKSLQELWLMRNEIFAKHDKPFNTYELYAYFMGKGYKPDKNYNDKRLSKIELANVNYILEKEKKLSQSNYIMENSKRVLSYNNVINRFQFPGFAKEEIEKFAKNGFLVVPARNDQLFHVYEENDYNGIASFITTDLVMQLSHVFFDTTLKRIEEESLYASAERFTEGMMRSSDNTHKSSNNNKIKEASKRNIAYFAVPYYYLEKGRKFDRERDEEVSNEEQANSTGETEADQIISLEDLEKSGIPRECLSYDKVKEYLIDKINQCNKHAGIKITRSSDELPYKGPFDYSQFIPRGHYTRSKLLKKYFMALMWYGTFSFDINDDMELVQALLMTHQLFTEKIENRYLIEYWRDIYDLTAFYVGYADDFGPDDFKRVLDAVFGGSPVEDYTDPQKLATVKKMLNEYFNNKTKIKQIMVYEKGPQGGQFRFMGQRYIPDSEVMQSLVKPLKRIFPKSLDVMAAFGSRIAKDLMLTKFKEDWQNFPEYPGELDKLIGQFGGLKEKEWQQNLYYSWLWSLKSIFELSKNHAYPFFMNNDAYLTKNLNSSLASWTELRHDTILYAKQSYGAECGGGGEEKLEWIPEPPKGYVEPNVEFYKRLLELLSQAKEGLIQRKLLGSTQGSFSRFIEAVTFLKNVAEKELKTQPLTLAEFEQIRRFGSLIDNLTLSIMEQHEWRAVAGPDRSIQLVADVHTASSMVLEEGVGDGFEIYVIVEIDGRLKLTRGAVFSYYEFQWPIGDRLTDEKWQDMVNNGKQPPLPKWIDIYYSKNPKKNNIPAYVPTNEIQQEIGKKQPGWYSIYYETGS
jgi:hypothetical protein